MVPPLPGLEPLAAAILGMGFCTASRARAIAGAMFLTYVPASSSLLVEGEQLRAGGKEQA